MGNRISEREFAHALHDTRGTPFGDNVVVNGNSSVETIARALHAGIQLPAAVRRRLPRGWEEVFAEVALRHESYHAYKIGRAQMTEDEFADRFAVIPNMAAEESSSKRVRSEAKRQGNINAAKAMKELAAPRKPAAFEMELSDGEDSDSDFENDDPLSLAAPVSARTSQVVRAAKELATAEVKASARVSKSKERAAHSKAKKARRVALIQVDANGKPLRI